MTRKKNKAKRNTKRRQSKPVRPKSQQVELGALKAIVDRAKTALSDKEHEQLKAAIDTLAFITRELESKRVSIGRLKKLLFGASTEKTSRVVSAAAGAGHASSNGVEDSETEGSQSSSPKPKPKGHGRNGAAAYRSAEKVKVPHEQYKPGERCPECEKGKLYPVKEPAVLVRVTGMAPLQAKVYECERLRCNLCGQVFTARAPDGVGKAKYDETASSMIALLKYGTGVPFNRLERLQRGLGIPLPASTQWDLVRGDAEKLVAVYGEIVRQAAQGKVLYNDDTTMRILDLMGLRREKAMAKGELDEDDRTGIFTSGIVSTCDKHKVALFFTGSQHAGENLSDVLAQRASELAPPIQMSDALSRNAPKDFETIMANCNAHARRNFVDVADSFPEEVRHVLEELREVYKNDELARQQEMTDEQRLELHQVRSGPVMKRLKKWLKEQTDERKVEPNSSLGDAIEYMLDHWDKLTLFLHVAGAPLDNNIVERALKRTIQHRKNSLFYRSENGAMVGDMFMTLIYSAELNGIDPFNYLVTLLRHCDTVSKAPVDWMPWNYRDTLASLPQ